ncbi:c-type cytochrome [Psychrobacter sp. DM4]|uniref:c-type cytochrome n=1 Tax=Psychrobacter sp. DM4 TaxID=3440637 RepID=UPI003F50302C
MEQVLTSKVLTSQVLTSIVSKNKALKFISLKAMIGTTLMSAVLALSACSSPVDPDIKARQDIMKSYGDAMGIMGGMVKAPDTFDAALLKDQTSYLAEASKSPWVHFGNAESMGNATEAVWSDNETFVAESEKFQQVTADLDMVAQTATSVDDFKPAFGEVGASCKSCHTEFKVKDSD